MEPNPIAAIIGIFLVGFMGIWLYKGMDVISDLFSYMSRDNKAQHRYNKLMRRKECKCSPECLLQTKRIRLLKALKRKH